VDARNRLVTCDWSERKVAETIRSLSCSDADFCAAYVRNKKALQDLGHRCKSDHGKATHRNGESLLWHLKIHGIINGDGPRFQWADGVTPFVKAALSKLINCEELNRFDLEALEEHGFDRFGYLVDRKIVIQ
jgi:hypothetical protein